MRTSKKTQARRRSIKVLDAACREQIVERDKNTCQWCGGGCGTQQWAHILSRRALALRHDPDNSLILGAGCHLRWHHEPLVAVTWFIEKFPDRYARLLEKRRNSVKLTAKDLKEMAANV